MNNIITLEQDSHLYHGVMAIQPDIGCTEVTVEPNEFLHIKPHIMPASMLPKPKVIRI
jgi:hypothetical protein